MTSTTIGFRTTLSDGTELRLTGHGPDVLRVQLRPPGAGERPSLAVIDAPDDSAWQITEKNGATLLRSGAISVSVADSGLLQVSRDGVELLATTSFAFPTNDLDDPDDRVGAELACRLPAETALHGLGQFPDGVMNWRGHEATLIHGNVTVIVPFLLSSAGWGVLWDNAAHTTFSDDANGMRLWSEVGDGVDAYFCFGADADGVIAGYRRLTGAAPLFPRAFHGFIQCKERYETADELVSVVQEHRDRNLPLDVIVQDWRYWGEMNQWSSMVHDPDAFGDLPAAIDTIHEAHAKVMISIWPVVGPDAALAKDLDEAGHMFPTIHWSSGKIYDAFSAEARAIYWQHARDGLFRHGVDAWWMDGTEPEFADCHDPMAHKASLLAQRATAAGTWARVLNAFSLATTQGVYEGQRAETDAKRVFILTRSAFAGQQRYAAATWSGDIGSSWEVFANQIPAGLNFCMAGIPWWTTDNGAFFVRGHGGVFPQGVADPAFREFFLRWFQWSCFCPLMRSHGTQTPREIWQFGEPGDVTYDSLADFARLRMQLLPYTYSLAHRTWRDSYTLMRGLVMDFPAEPHLHDIADQYMYGPAFLVCPVTKPMVAMPTDRLDPLGNSDLRRSDDERGHAMAVFDGLDDDTAAWTGNRGCFTDYTWTGSNPPGATSDTYRVNLTATLQRQKQGPACLMVRCAGRIRLHLDGEVVIDDWVDGPTREHVIALTDHAGDAWDLVVEYGHVTGDAVLQLGWEMQHQWTEPQPQERPVILPSGTWYDFWSNDQLVGGTTVVRPAPLDCIPVMVRAGSIVPLGAVKQWHDETDDQELTIKVYPGADGSFTLCEDAGDGYGYEQGECAVIPFTWDDASRTLTVGERSGSFPGMISERRWLVRCMDQPDAEPVTVTYTGTTCSVTLA